MVYVLGAAIAGLTVGRAGSAISAVANVALFKFCFFPPRFGFAVVDRHYLVTFAAMLTIALIIAQLVATVRARAREMSAEARHTTQLYEMSRELVMARDEDSLTHRRSRAAPLSAHRGDGYRCHHSRCRARRARPSARGAKRWDCS
jgi:two-component system sensor histidine kinase KdpD